MGSYIVHISIDMQYGTVLPRTSTYTLRCMDRRIVKRLFVVENMFDVFKIQLSPYSRMNLHTVTQGGAGKLRSVSHYS